MRSNKHTEAGQSHLCYTPQLLHRTSAILTSIVTTMAITAAFGPFAAAQSDAPAGQGVQEASAIEEIQVTARKRGNESIQDIPVAITAISEETLQRMGVSDFDDFAYQVPGLTFNDAGPGEKRYIIRGVQSAGQQQVAVYYDEVPIPGVQSSTSDSGSQTTDLKIYDFQRVEVL
ncbi:MAG TPA: Plug domain-containing protein, partial [Xanthomonadales bacterium]|nr:Plug domain-containing protein [Xanthomonadales bacterium]